MSAIWQPYWVKSTAYTLTAVVIPTVFTGYTWRCTTAGTSDTTEPTWPDPTLGTTTIVDGTVTWSMGTGWRQATQLGIYNLVKAFSVANPTIVRSVRTVRPPSFAASTSLPCFYLANMDESIVTFQGSQTRTLTGFTGILVDQLGTIEDSNDRMNFAADVLSDLFVLNYHAIGPPGSIFEHTGTVDTEESDKGVIYPALEFQFFNTKYTAGRT
jgi:hypothetical protein